MAHEIEIINRVLNGNIESFRLLVERYETGIVRMIANITFNRESSEDIAQDVFFTAYRKLSSFDPSRSEFSTWLFTIARNKSINALRKKRVFVSSQLPEKTHSHNPAGNIERAEFFDLLDKQLHALPAGQRRAFVLAEFEELPYEKIAQIEGVRIGTVRSRIHRAKKKLQSALTNSDGELI